MLKYSKIHVNHTFESNTAGLDKEFFVPFMWGSILNLVGIRPKNMCPGCGALSVFGFALWLRPHVSPGWEFTVKGAIFSQFAYAIVIKVKGSGHQRIISISF